MIEDNVEAAADNVSSPLVLRTTVRYQVCSDIHEQLQYCVWGVQQKYYCLCVARELFSHCYLPTLNTLLTYNYLIQGTRKWYHILDSSACVQCI